MLVPPISTDPDLLQKTSFPHPNLASSGSHYYFCSSSQPHHMVSDTKCTSLRYHTIWAWIPAVPVSDDASPLLPNLALPTISSGIDNYIGRARIPDGTASDTVCRSPHDQQAWNCILCRHKRIHPCYTFDGISAYLNICICHNSRPEGTGCYVGGLPNCFT